jgi:glyoxylase-like metal-dependent hydrolase (beta-lactamase superfamily II)
VSPRLLALLTIAALSACVRTPAVARRELERPGIAAVETTINGRNPSMIYLARTDSGVIAIDLGWTRADAALDRGLRRLGASRESVAAVFLTHSHRDHIGAWRAVAGAPFYLGAPEVDLLRGRAEFGGWVPRTANRLHRADGPRPGELRLRPFASDTIFVFGADTLRAYLVPGHTAGSAAYLFRGVLFAGDAISKTYVAGRLRPARAGYSDDAAQAGRSLADLLAKAESSGVRVVCTAHARCAAYTPELRRRLAGR